jgi:Tfp pilus assembly protein PilO
VKARDQLSANYKAVTQLQTSYTTFVESPQNRIGGSSIGKADKDGDNAKIILDALPSQYDFPALATSLEKLISATGVETTISGTDDEVNQALNTAAAAPAAVEMPFGVTAKGTYDQSKQLFSAMDRSIRPFAITQVSIAAAEKGSVSVTMAGNTYYQPGKSLKIKAEVIK